MLRRSTASTDSSRRGCIRITAKLATKRISACSRRPMTFWRIRGGARSTIRPARKTQAPPEPLAATIDFMDVMDGELNRRLAVLAVLYYRRRTNPTYPEVPLAEIEERMGFPRDYLDFTLWYLQRKGYVTKADNAQYTLSVDGVDFRRDATREHSHPAQAAHQRFGIVGRGSCAHATQRGARRPRPSLQLHQERPTSDPNNDNP
jgi:hypothetical protein